MSHEDEVARLFTDWLNMSARVIWERSGRIEHDIRELVEQGKRRAAELGIPWQPELIPEGIRTQLEAWDQFDDLGIEHEVKR